MTSNRPDDDNAWNYMRPLPPVQPYMLMDPLEDGTYECVALDGLPAKVTSNSDNPPNSFRTRDIFHKHPTIPNAWKHLGRIDDRVTLTNGEKVLPIPIEHRIRQSEWVKEVLVFGIGKPLPGLLVIPSEKCTRLEKQNILDKVWPDIAAANEASDAFSQILRDYVLILDIDATYPATDKGTIIRKASYKHFHDLIEAVYENQESGDNDATEKLSLSRGDLEGFLLNLFKQDLNFMHINIDTDFFDAGMDSLQSIQARGRVQKQISIGSSKLAQNVDFETGSIRKLAQHLYDLRVGQDSSREDEIATMAKLVERYSDFKKLRAAEKEVVVS
jgi:acyl-CoA synthetase (AMP-forming)/AMP-acid ligase II